jgi:hypothetical protein
MEACLSRQLGRLCIGALLLAACAHVPSAPETNGAPADGPNQRFDDELIERLVGEWTLVRSIRGKQEENRVKAEWVLHHQFLQLHMRDAADPPKYEALVLIGAGQADKPYVAHWCDTWGGPFSADAFGKRAGNSIEFEFHYPEGPFFNTFTWDPARQGWTFLMQNGKADGTRTLFAEDVLRKP